MSCPAEKVCAAMLDTCVSTAELDETLHVTACAQDLPQLVLRTLLKQETADQSPRQLPHAMLNTSRVMMGRPTSIFPSSVVTLVELTQ